MKHFVGERRRSPTRGNTRLPDVGLRRPAGSPCRTGKGKVAVQYHTARFRLVPQLAKTLNVATPAVRKPGSAWIELQFLTGELQGSHDPSGVVFTVLAALSGMEREYIRHRTLEGHESARTRGKTIGGASVTDPHMLSMALHLRTRQLSLRDIAARLVITKGKKKGQHPSPATVLRLLREHDETTTAVPASD